RSRGVRVWSIEALFAVVVAVAVTMSIQWIGLLVINSMLVLPAAAARNVARDTPRYVFWAVLIGAIAALLYLLVRFYRRDVAELSKPVRILLIMLRVATVLALVFFFFDLQRRAQRMVTRPSEVAILVDTSQSMSLPADLGVGSASRSERAAELLASTDLLNQLATEHRVSVYAFGDQVEPRLIESLGGEVTPGDEAAAGTDSQGENAVAVLGGLLIAAGLLLALISLLVGAAGRGATVGWWVLASAGLLVPGILCLGGVYAIHTERTLGQLLGVEPTASPTSEPSSDEPKAAPAEIRVVDWEQEIAAAAPQSRIGDAIRNVLADHDPATLAGVVLISDGQSNGGTDANVAVAAARRNEVAIYPVGLGSSDAPINVRVVDLDAPRRVYPGDKFAVTALLQASGPRPIAVDVQLLDGLDNPDDQEAEDPAGPAAPPGDVIESQRVEIKNDGSLTAIRFELEPESVGRRRLAVRLVAPPEDQNQRDDLRDARYEVVSRKLKVMAVAGGPTREYRFVRNLFFRDNSIELDVWLQTGQPGMSQDADRVLQGFPDTAEELFQYDVIAMFDPYGTGERCNTETHECEPDPCA
ncbi:MAG: metal ABC transporter permease, partial [Planctomycetes bacterium]|nr:metal ABC transporter permease [Planctomycetota bacterium]